MHFQLFWQLEQSLNDIVVTSNTKGCSIISAVTHIGENNVTVRRREDSCEGVTDSTASRTNESHKWRSLEEAHKTRPSLCSKHTVQTLEGRPKRHLIKADFTSGGKDVEHAGVHAEVDTE